ncbi:MAG: peptidoglycan-binding domain-containing protein, partial [Aggregatilineales bacterium]
MAGSRLLRSTPSVSDEKKSTHTRQAAVALQSDNADPTMFAGLNPNQAEMLRAQQTVGNAAVRRKLAARQTYGPDVQQAQEHAFVQRLVSGMGIAGSVVQRAPGLPVNKKSSDTDIKEVQTKLNALGVSDSKGKQIVVVVNGTLDKLTVKAIKRFQSAHGLSTDGVVGPKTWAEMAPGTTAVSTPWSETVGGVNYAMTSNYDYQITPGQVHVTVKLKFTGVDAPAVINNWFSAIKSNWNRFKVVNTADKTAKPLDIYFEPIAVTSGQHNSVQIMAGSGRSDAGKWYVKDSNSGMVASHEFGHMLGLPDEYQLAHADYKTTTGVDAAKGKTKGNATDAKIAKELHDGLALGTEPDRYAAVYKAVITDHKLKQGDFAETINTKYKADYGTDLVKDLVAGLSSANQWSMIEPFTHSGGGVMGDFYSH